MQQQNQNNWQAQTPNYNYPQPQGSPPPSHLQHSHMQMNHQPPQGQYQQPVPSANFHDNRKPPHGQYQHSQFQDNRPPPEPLSPYKPNQQQKQAIQPTPNPPNTPAEWLDYIKKKPHTQLLAGQQFTYSILPKKQQTMFGSNNRVLMLKGLEAIAYAREMPANKQLPFSSFEDVPPPKASFPITEIEKCQAADRKLTISFSGAKKVIWQFECPTKACATEWAEKIDNATMTLHDFKQSGYHSLEEFNRNKKEIDQQRRIQGSNEVNALLNRPYEGPNQGSTHNSMNATLIQSPPSPLRHTQFNQHNEGPNLTINQQQQGLSQSKAVPFGSNLFHNSAVQQSNHKMLSSHQVEFITNYASSSNYEPEKALGKSISKFNISDKEGIRLQLSKIRRNWLEELIGGEQQVELIMEFRNYVERIASVLINQLYIPNDRKIFPPMEQTKEYATYLLEDVYLEVYYHTQESQDRKHPRYQQATLEFKNMDYLLSVTKNQGNLKVPFMVLFEYKGFLGMAKSRVADPNAPPKNREFYGQLNIREFEDTARINAETLLNENTCKIVSYERKTSLSATMANRRIYFVDKLTELLPVEKQLDNNPYKILRAEMLQDDSFEGLIFRDKRRPIYPEKLNQLIERKIDEFIRLVEQEEEYFTNSTELAQLIHLSGLNVRHLGRIYLKARLGWFRRILQGEIIARSIKSLFRYDIQNVVMVQAERQASRSSQQEAERRRVISFLNVLFGNSESTTGIWKRINSISRDKFGVVVAENSIGDTNVQFLMQAVQTHLKIVMNDSIHTKIRFQSTQTFEPQDFNRFQFNTTIYDLEFSNLFEQIDECLTTETSESFYNLSAILIKETSTRVPYIEILKRHPIHDRISEFLLNFTSPSESKELYSKLQLGLLPSRFLYESKLAEIKWFLKANKPEQIKQISSFIFEHTRKWLGTVHPLYAQLNRLQASYYANHSEYFQTALKHANESLEMQRKIFDGEAEALWKDYFLLGKIYFNNKKFEEGMKHLLKAKEMVNVRALKEFETYSELNLFLCKGFFAAQNYREAYNIVKDLYALTRNEKDELTLSYSLDAVNWIRQLYEVSQDNNSYFQFLESQLANNMRAYLDYPNILSKAIRMVTVSSLKHAVHRRSRNTGRILGLCEEVGKIAESTQNSLAGYIKEKLVQGTFPRNFLIQLKEIDMIYDQIVGGQMLERWRQFYLTSGQFALDSLGSSQVPRGFQFLANLTALFNLFGRQVLDELRMIDRR